MTIDQGKFFFLKEGQLTIIKFPILRKEAEDKKRRPGNVWVS